MNPGISEELGQTARSIIHVLGSQPFTLTMIVSNFLLLGFIWYSQVEDNRQRAALGREFLTYVDKTQALIAKCIVPNKGGPDGQ